MDKSWDTFEFLGRFPIYTYPAPAPPLTPQTTLDACFQNFFSTLFLTDRVLICGDAIKWSILSPSNAVYSNLGFINIHA